MYGAAQTGSPVILFITVIEAINKGLLKTLSSEFLGFFYSIVRHSLELGCMSLLIGLAP